MPLEITIDKRTKQVEIARGGTDYMDSVHIYPSEIEGLIDQLEHYQWLIEQDFGVNTNPSSLEDDYEAHYGPWMETEGYGYGV